jgi:bifunctional UDP-N-acetylglucosamine pyrophosphorylase/glucosamine-1-phosphate N-acetyltransferase
MHSKSTAAVIMAAGKGTRMKSDLPKVLHKLGGKPIVEYVVSTAREVGAERILLVIGYKWELAKKALKHLPVEFVVQKEQLGTGHAVLQTEKLLSDFEGDVLVLCGDAPLLRAGTLDKLLGEHRERKASATVLSAILDHPAGYGRVVRDKTGFVQEIVEEKDAGADQRRIREINTGTFCFDRTSLFSALRRVTNDNEQREYYLTDTLKVLRQDGLPVWGVVAADPAEGLGINSEKELEEMERLLLARGFDQTATPP